MFLKLKTDSPTDTKRPPKMEKKYLPRRQKVEQLDFVGRRVHFEVLLEIARQTKPKYFLIQKDFGQSKPVIKFKLPPRKLSRYLTDFNIHVFLQILLVRNTQTFIRLCRFSGSLDWLPKFSPFVTSLAVTPSPAIVSLTPEWGTSYCAIVITINVHLKPSSPLFMIQFRRWHLFFFYVVATNPLCRRHDIFLINQTENAIFMFYT